jgi:hypothetical protein
MTQPRHRSEHIAARPLWTCRACEHPWPCDDAKAELLHEFRHFPSVLTIYMSAQMHVAVVDLTTRYGSPPADLFERFLSWLRPMPGHDDDSA